VRTSRFLLQGGQIIGIKTAFPTIEGLGRYAEAAAGLARVAAASIIIKPLEPVGGVLGDGPLANQGPDKFRTRNDVPIDTGWMWN
jgi:hypothetical protein